MCTWSSVPLNGLCIRLVPGLACDCKRSALVLFLVQRFYEQTTRRLR